MKLLFIGGDERSVYAAEALSRVGEVAAYAMEKADLPPGVRKAESLENADCVVLPVPAQSKRPGELNAPFSEKHIQIAELLRDVPEGTRVFGGRLGGLETKAELIDLLDCPDFVVGNADITAEGAVYRLMRELPGTVAGAKILVIGCGRIGQLLCRKLTALGAEVYIQSNNAQTRAMLCALGCHQISELSDMDAIVNTAPAASLTDYGQIRSRCILLELASVPGFDASEAKKHGLRLLTAPGLPGKYAPKKAGELIAQTVREWSVES